MRPSTFLFTDILNTALRGIDASVLPVIQFIAGSILTVTFLWGIYDAYVRGGDMRSLGINFLKFAAATFVILNWGQVFRDVTSCFDYISGAIIGSSGITDWWNAWIGGLLDVWKEQGMVSLWTLLRGGLSALISGVCLLAGYILLPLGMAIFVLTYVFWGCVLYVLGPLVVAAMPSSTLGRFHVRWIENFFVWNCWALLACTFTALMSALHLAEPSDVISRNNLLGYFQGVGTTTLLSLVSILMSLVIVTIPFTARSILLGEFSPVGAVLLFLGRAAAKVAKDTATKAAAGATGAGSGGGPVLAGAGPASGGSPFAAAGRARNGGGGGSTLGPPPDTPPPSGTTRFFPAYR